GPPTAIAATHARPPARVWPSHRWPVEVLVTPTVATAIGVPPRPVTLPWMAAVVTPCAPSGAAITSASASGRSVGPLTLRPQQLFERRIVVERLEARIGVEGGGWLLPEFAVQPQPLLVCLGDQAHGSRSLTQLRGDAGAPVSGRSEERRVGTGDRTRWR